MTRKPAPPKDPEIAAFTQLLALLAPLSPEVATRVLTWGLQRTEERRRAGESNANQPTNGTAAPDLGPVFPRGVYRSYVNELEAVEAKANGATLTPGTTALRTPEWNGPAKSAPAPSPEAGA